MARVTYTGSMSETVYDILVIGGGINGTGIAADAAGRGLKVFLAEAADLASATSSASSKLIHGGLRYLEHYEFRLVREALGERERLMAKAPHLIWPLRFVLPHMPGMRPDIALRAGLFLYDHLAPRRQLGSSSAINLKQDPAGAALNSELSRGYSYYDCWVDDARLVVANALAAAANGAVISTRTLVDALISVDGMWSTRIRRGGLSGEVRARAVVNAAGPWVSHVAGLASTATQSAPPKLRLVKGSHIVVPRLSATGEAYIFQNVDGRVVFALPYERDFTLIGTTDVPFTGRDPRTVTIDTDEVAYLLAVAARYFRTPVQVSDVVWSFSGVRPLEDDGAASASAVSRDYHLELERGAGPPLLNVVGGKVTTYRRLAEAALEKLRDSFPNATGAWTEEAPLPGGEMSGRTFSEWFADLCRLQAGFATEDLLRLARRYGTRVDALLDGAKSAADLGPNLGGDLTAAEVRFLKATEWAQTVDDVLWRRTKAGLHVGTDQRATLARRVDEVLSGS